MKIPPLTRRPRKKPAKPVTLKTLCQRASRASGQLKSIPRMVREKRSHEELLNLILAIEGSVYSIIYQQFDPIIRRYLAARLNDLSKEPDLPPELITLIDEIRKNFPHYQVSDLPKVFHDIKALLSRPRD